MLKLIGLRIKLLGVRDICYIFKKIVYFKLTIPTLFFRAVKMTRVWFHSPCRNSFWSLSIIINKKANLRFKVMSALVKSEFLQSLTVIDLDFNRMPFMHLKIFDHNQNIQDGTLLRN